jgi:hypothetical protein
VCVARRWSCSLRFTSCCAVCSLHPRSPLAPCFIPDTGSFRVKQGDSEEEEAADDGRAAAAAAKSRRAGAAAAATVKAPAAAKGDGKYVPPHLRKAVGGSGKNERLTRSLRGLMNRMGEANLANIVGEVCAPVYQHLPTRKPNCPSCVGNQVKVL